MNAITSKAKAIFIEMVGRIPSEQWNDYLDSAYGEDEQLRQEIESLLDAHSDADSFLAQPAIAPTVAQPSPKKLLGFQVGPYKLREQIGEGGMGVVYVAEQTEPVKRKVALKLIKPGMDSQQVVARFEAERQALAMMDHPNIARVFDGGSTAGGQPFFVMELVQGLPITEYCDNHRLATRERLQLFLQVCRAVQHAHQRGIIHRDLKPSNVLVSEIDDTAVPKVIDFGVAKAVHQRLAEQTLYTQFSQVVGTPLYMSPEQAGLGVIDVDTRSDIYSLGVLLYELLTGSTPFDGETLKQAGFDEMRRIIREDEPPKPSAKVSTLDAQALSTLAQHRRSDARKLSASLEGELDWIVMKAMEKDRNRRYASAGALAADLQRFLNDEAVEACPPSSAYLVRKFVRRNKGPVVAAGLVLATLLAGIAGTTLGLVDARNARLAEAEQRQLAEANERKALSAAAAEREARLSAQQRLAQAQAILDFVEDHILAAIGPEGEQGGLGREVTLRQAIESALSSVETSFQKDPVVETYIRATLGIAFFNLGEYETAAKQFKRARELNGQHRGPDHANTLSNMFDLANCYSNLGRRAEALELYEEVLAIRKAKLGPDHPDTLDSTRAVADCLARLGRLAKALELTEATLARQKAILGPDHIHTLDTSMSLANRYEDAGRHGDALQLREETLEQMKTKRGPTHRLTLLLMYNMGRGYHLMDRYSDAVRMLEETLALQEAQLGRDHPNTLATMQQLANAYHHLGQHADALKLNEETLARKKAKYGPDHPSTLLTMGNLAQTYTELGRHADARRLRNEVSKAKESAPKEEKPPTPPD